MQKLVEGLSGAHEGGDAELTLDLHGALQAALTEESGAPAVGEAIGALLQHAPHVTELDVGGAKFGAAGIAPVARALAENHSLAHLGIAACCLGPGLDGAKRLAAAIRQNGDLLSLDVRHNGLDAAAIKLLKSAASARPRSNGGKREPLDVRTEPQAFLPPGSMVQRTPRE